MPINGRQFLDFVPLTPNVRYAGRSKPRPPAHHTSAFVRYPVHAVAIRHVPAVCAFRRLPGQLATFAASILDAHAQFARCFIGDFCARSLVSERIRLSAHRQTETIVLTCGAKRKMTAHLEVARIRPYQFNST